MFSIFTTPLRITRKPMGSILTAAALPPVKPLRCFTRSPPPPPKPKVTRETGTSVTPSGVVTGSPTMVLTSTISLILDMLVCRKDVYKRQIIL